MGTTVPFDVLNNGEIELNAANFPSCMGLFVAKDLQVGVDTEWVDRIHGITVPVASLATSSNADSNARNFEIALNTVLSSGAWGDLTGKDFLMFVVAEKNISGEGGLTVGAGTSGVRVRDFESAGSPTKVVHDGTNIDVSSGGVSHTKGEVILYGIAVDVDGNAIVKEVTVSGGFSDIESFATTNVSNFGGTPDAKLMLSEFENIYYFAVFRFDALPADIDATLLWVFDSAKNGNIGLPPNWKNKT